MTVQPMTVGTITVLRRASRPIDPGGRCTVAGLRRGLLLFAVVLTAIAGPLGRPASDLGPSEDVFRPVLVPSFTAAASVR